MSRDSCITRHSVDVVSSCKPFTWINGITYVESIDSVFHVVSTESGCDSIIELKFTLDSLELIQQSVTSLAPFYWEKSRGVYSSDTTAKAIHLQTDSCGKIYELNLKITGRSKGGGFETTDLSFNNNRSFVFDINNDGLDDILNINAFQIPATLINNGINKFIKLENPEFSGYRFTTIIPGDIDNDGDIDFYASFLRQNAFSYERAGAIFLNNGTGRFIRNESFELPHANFGKLEFVDLNGDDKLDLFFVCFVSLKSLIGNESVRGYFLNDGNGNFVQFKSLDQFSPYDQISHKDFNGDGFIDILSDTSTEPNNFSKRKSRIYWNDGWGSFSDSNTLEISAYAVHILEGVDLNLDSYPDIVEYMGDGSLIYHLNNGFGSFQDYEVSQKISEWADKLFFSDFDTDGDIDLFLTGSKVPVIYENKGHLKFVKVDNTPFVGGNQGYANLIDLEGDKDIDLIVQGIVYNFSGCFPSSTIQSVTAIDNFTWIDGVKYTQSTSTPMITIKNANGCDSTINLNLTVESSSRVQFEKVFSKKDTLKTQISIDLGDINSDNLTDFVALSWGIEKSNQIQLFTNLGNNNFQIDSIQDNSRFKGSLILADIDNDSDNDLLAGTNYLLSLLNDGKGYFSPDSGWISGDNEIDSWGYKKLEFLVSDIDLDGDKDIITNLGAPQRSITSKDQLTTFWNQGSKLFIESKTLDTSAYTLIPIALIDLDNDIYPDLIVQSMGQSGPKRFDFFRNIQGQKFERFEDSGISTHGSHKLGFVDIDNDFDIDLFITFYDAVKQKFISNFYYNNGKAQFNESISKSFITNNLPSFGFYDLDGNGFTDLFLTDQHFGPQGNKLFYNLGKGIFLEESGEEFASDASTIRFTDFNNDHAPDILLAGSFNLNSFVEIYINKNSKENCYSDRSTDLVITDKPFTWINGTTYSQTTNSAQITLKNEFGCDSLVTLNLVIAENVLDKSEYHSDIKVFPNPTNSYLIIELPADYPSEQISIIDMNGKSILEMDNFESGKWIDIRSLSSGNYFISGKTPNDHIWFKRFSKVD